MNRSPRTDEILLSSQIVDREGLTRAYEVQQRDGGSLGRILGQLGLAEEEAVCRAIAAGVGLECPSLESLSITQETADLLTEKICRSRLVAPIGWEGRSLRLAMADPLDDNTIQDVEFSSGKRVVPCVATETAILGLLGRLYRESSDDANAYDLLSRANPAGEAEIAPAFPEDADIGQLARDVKQPPTIRLVNMILSDAASAGASDVHIEPQENGVLVRHRLDGLLHDVLHLPKRRQDATISRLKVVAGMDISERRKPQDGRSRLRFQGRRIDLRVSTLPTQYGEKVVIRLLDSSGSRVEMGQLGFDPATLGKFQGLLRRPQGFVLVTGPTGSGKTSTLYASLNWVKSPTTNIITVEDPIEYQIAGINQVQINPKAGITFASGLRSILRQDPNVVLVGEIRDHETAAIALEAALTGHMMLSTLHTNDAPGSITRLLDLGIEPYHVATSLTCALAQRLLRRLCPACTVERAPTAAAIEWIGGEGRLPSAAVWKAGRGCDACSGSGYKGRTAVHELLAVTDEIRELVSSRSPEHRLRDAARRAGMKTLMEDALVKAAQGFTTLEEVIRVVPPDESLEARARSTTRPIEAAPREALPAESVPEISDGVQRRVLVVEDSPTVASVVRYFLELEGFEVCVAQDGNEGLEMARHRRPHVIVTDVNMPGMDGMEMVSTLRRDPLTREVAILMLTSESSVERETEALTAGADDYLVKPVEPRRLAARVKALLTRARTEQATAS